MVKRSIFKRHIALFTAIAIITSAALFIVLQTVFAAEEESKEHVGSTVSSGCRYSLYSNGKATFFRVNDIHARKTKKTVTIRSKVSYEGNTYTVDLISNKAFTGCKKLKTIKVLCTESPEVQKGAFANRNTKKIKIKVTKKMPKTEYKVFTKSLKKAGFKGNVTRY